MGQVFSNIWRCIHRPNIEADTTTLQNDQYAPVEEQAYYITIPDGDIYMAQPDAITEVLPFIAVNLINDRAEQDEEAEGEEEEEEVVERVIQVVVQEEVTSQVIARPIDEYGVSEKAVRRIGPYTSIQRILLVGEGDFSFSTSLAVAFDSASNMIATSLNTQEYLTNNYRKFLAHKRELENRGCMLIHGVDATTMIRHSVLGKLKFDIIIYNFPHAGRFGSSDADTRKNQNLIKGFVRSAKKMIDEDGEIHITHKSNRFFRQWDIPKIGCDEGLHLIQKIRFKRSMYPGYHTKFGYKDDRDFNCNPSKTYKFGLRPKSI